MVSTCRCPSLTVGSVRAGPLRKDDLTAPVGGRVWSRRMKRLLAQFIGTLLFVGLGLANPWAGPLSTLQVSDNSGPYVTAPVRDETPVSYQRENRANAGL
jgi:hypothetical protein